MRSAATQIVFIATTIDGDPGLAKGTYASSHTPRVHPRLESSTIGWWHASSTSHGRDPRARRQRRRRQQEVAHQPAPPPARWTPERWKYDLDPLTRRETAEVRLEEAEDRERAMDEYRAAVVQARTASRRNAAGTQELEGAVSAPALEELGCQGTRALPDGWEEVR